MVTLKKNDSRGAYIKKKTFAKENSSILSFPPPRGNNGPLGFFGFRSILQNGYPQGIIRHHINDVLEELFHTKCACSDV